MQSKIALEEHVAIEPTLGDSQVFGAHVWTELRHRLLDVQDTRLREMDSHAIEMMILSLNAPAVQAIHDVKTAIAVARQANDALASEVRKRPDRFASFAALPMQDWAGQYEGHNWLLGPDLAFTAEAAVHALRLIGSGLFDECPRLQIVLGHLGEGLPGQPRRIDGRHGLQ